MTEEEKPYYETATAERIAKAQEATEPFKTDSGRNTLRMLDGHIIELLYSRKAINGDQYNAGLRLAADFNIAGLSGMAAMDYAREIVDAGRRFDVPDHRLDAAHRWARAITAVGGTLAQALRDIVCLEEPMEHFGRKLHGAKNKKQAIRDALIHTKLALTALDEFYYGPRKRTGVQSAHTEDYRPTMEKGDE